MIECNVFWAAGTQLEILTPAKSNKTTKTHDGIIATFNFTGTDNIIGSASLYDALLTLYLDGEVYDIDDLVVLAGSGSGSASASGSATAGIAFPDTVTGLHTVEYVLSDGIYILPNGEMRTGYFTGNENIVGSITAASKYCTTSDANGYEYVDLGLPSGTLWATCNVGTTSPEGYGRFFLWADTTGHTEGDTSITSGFLYTWGNTPYNSGGSTANNNTTGTFTKYTTEGDILDVSDDAASVNLGGSWLMPTKEQCAELINKAYTKIEYNVEVNGVKGHRFTSRKDSTKSIFIPYAGYCDESDCNNAGSYADLWSDELYYSTSAFECYLGAGGDRDVYGSGRCVGLSVRGVLRIA